MKIKSLFRNIFIKTSKGRMHANKVKFIMDGKEIPIKNFNLVYGIDEFMGLFPVDTSIKLTVETDERS